MRQAPDVTERSIGFTVPVAPFAQPAERVADTLATDPAGGLTSQEAARRLAMTGPNALERQQRKPVWGLIWDAATEPFVLLLAAAGGIAVLLGEVRDGLLVLLGLLPIVGADVITSYRGERALETLRDAAAPRARVRRDGTVQEVPAADLVPGDLVLLQTGDVVPADLRILDSRALLVDRSVLTGESLPEAAHVAPDSEASPLADRHSMGYAGTSVVGGRATGVVTATGQATELGQVASTLGPLERDRSPLQRELDRLVKILLAVAIGLIAITIGFGVLRGDPWGETVLAAVSAAIAAIPEEPPILLAVVLGLGAYRLLRRGVLVRRLSAQETLGSVDLILTDKTGTITENRLGLAGIRTPDGPIEQPSARLAVALDAYRAEEDAWGVGAGVRPGSFTRVLAQTIEELGARPELDPAELLDAAGAGDGRSFSWTRARRNGLVEELALGAPEAVLEMVNGDQAPIDDAWRELVGSRTSTGARLLLLARREDGGTWRPEAALEFRDQLRTGVPEALALASGAGIQAVMVTGDHALTASTIGREAGLPEGTVVTGPELDSWDDERLRRELPELRIVARAVPTQKLRLVELARSLGRTVAVTGDGVNDAPALNRADVAVAMGSGTAVAREASDLVLGDDSFVTLMSGLREGRRIVDNVQKGLVFLVSTHVALLGLLLIATIVGFSQPLLPLQILWLELFIDAVTAVAFEQERAEPDLMRRPPRPRSTPLLTTGLLGRIVLAGGFSAVAALWLMETHGTDPEHARWLAYTSLVVGQVVRANANRSITRPLTQLGINPVLALASLLVIAIQLAIPYLPAFAEAFHATPLAADDLLLVAVVALIPAVVADIVRRTGREWVA
jgi:Ca2+-transporting ATPase